MNDLSEYFRAQSRWREEKAEQYPDDKRNQQSARALESLADFIDEGEPNSQTIIALEAHLDHDSPATGFDSGGDAAREVGRYGYGYPVTEATNADFLEELVVLCLADAYAFAVEHGETGPSRYLTSRSRQPRAVPPFRPPTSAVG